MLYRLSYYTNDKVELAMGFEPATACLQNRCSTVELCQRENENMEPPIRFELMTYRLRCGRSTN